jgi:hypothetical protein
MLIIKLNNFKITVNKTGRKWYELQRISKAQTITTYASKKEIDGKIAILSQPIAELKKVYNF